MTLEAIKAAIADLPETDKASLAVWLIQQDAVAWDQQIEWDFSERGPGTALLQAWDAEIQAGESVPLEEFLRDQETTRKAK